jgi:hypothetical protein
VVLKAQLYDILFKSHESVKKMLKGLPFIKIVQLGVRPIRKGKHALEKPRKLPEESTMRNNFTMDKDDRKYLIWFLVGLVIAAIPWIAGMM